MSKVLILLSCYNGSDYIGQQIDSILNQTQVEIFTLVRDDGSSDDTQEIIKDYVSKYPDKFRLISGKNCGCKQSFFRLMEEAVKNFSDFTYFAFADQDDIWLPEKIKSGISLLDKAEDRYKLYYCDPVLVDGNLQNARNYHYNALLTFGESFVLQPCIGCSMIFNRAVLEKAVLGDPSNIIMHDSWVYQVNLSLGGIVIHDTKGNILYRQHGNNTIGYNQSSTQRWKRRLKMFINNDNRRSKQAFELEKSIGAFMPIQERESLDLILGYKKSFRSKVDIIFSNRFRSTKKLHNLLFKLAIFFNRI